MHENEHKGLDDLFRQLAEGQTPDFAQMMAAISDVSTIYPEPEPCSEDIRCVNCEM